MSQQQAEPNWAWLGLLKWSLSYTDGTVPSEESKNFKQMTDEDKAFLEEVMKNGIVDEGEQMKTILSNLVSNLESIKNCKKPSDGIEKLEKNSIELLEELRDIVEQIDYAKAFANMGGIKFLVGCASENKSVPKSVRSLCLAVLATICQNNPVVQYSMLEQGNIPKLVEIYFSGSPTNNGEIDNNDGGDVMDCITLQASAIQAMSCCVRNHDVAEKIFCMNSEGRHAIESSLRLNHEQQPAALKLRRKALFFLQALVTSDSADTDRVSLFSSCIKYVTANFCDPGKENNAELREMSLSMLNRILNQKKSVNAILDLKLPLVGLGVNRISYLRALDEEEAEYAKEELNLWESLMVELARARRDEEAEQPLLLESAPSAENLPQ